MNKKENDRKKGGVKMEKKENKESDKMNLNEMKIKLCKKRGKENNKLKTEAKNGAREEMKWMEKESKNNEEK